MNVERREFLKYVGGGAIASTLPPISLRSDPAPEQLLHRDYQSDNKGTEYYFIGNGLILVALQSVPTSEAGTHCGLLVMSSEHFGRKAGTYLYHPERGLQNSRCFATVDGAGSTADPATSKVSWIYPGEVPTILIEWRAGDCEVREQFWCPSHDSALIRTVTLKNTGSSPAEASLTVQLYPNLMFFDEYHVDRTRGTLTASGYKTLRLFSTQLPQVGDRHLLIRLGTLAPGEQREATFVLTLDLSREDFERRGIDLMKRESMEYWKKIAAVSTGDKGLDRLFKSSASGMRSAVAVSGKMDGSVWQYNLEWVRDQSMVAAASAMTGQSEIAEALLRRILSRSVDDTGKTVDASRHRPPETIELDQNGELLYALYTHWVWTGKDTIIRDHWEKIKKVAEYVLDPIFMEPSISLLKNVREYWERDSAFGVKEGYENTYQLWNIIGLEKASQMARALGDSAHAQSWARASQNIKESFLRHPKYSLVEDGRFIKRRLTSGEVQRTFEPPNRKAMPPGMPLNVERVSYCEPDAGSVLPIVFEVVDPRSSIAIKTLESMEQLWNQRWDIGGYARYHVTSEPDSPGPWPFPTLFIARAYLEAGNDGKAWRALKWLQQIQGGSSGAWLEYYGDRPTPPLPPVGIVVWTWAEIVSFFIHHMLGVRPSPDSLVIRPRLLSGLNEVRGNISLRGHTLTIGLHRDAKEPWAMIDGRRVAVKRGLLELPIPNQDTKVEIHLEHV